MLTRDIEHAKEWLRPLAIDVKRQCDVVHWFLDDKKDLKSSLFLEDVATEFDVQGLELDWACIAWDGDLRYHEGAWNYYRFGSNKWMNNKQEVNQAYQLNAYRVLLTRARQGMVICIPRGDTRDDSRLPEYYNETYNYFRSIGIPCIDEEDEKNFE